jgi:lipopolysaccharide export system protein LptA
MAGEGRHRSVQLLRQGLLAALVIFLGVVSALFYVRRPQSPADIDPDSRNPLRELVDIVSAGEGFEYEVTEGERTLFHIRAESMKTSRDNLFELQMALIEIEREDGRVYEMTADRAIFQDEGREKQTSLSGNAIVKSSGGAQVESEGFVVKRKGRLVTSTGPVRYRLGGQLRGTAKQLDAYLKQDRYQLGGGVEMRGGPENPSFALSCRRLIYDEKARRIHAEGDVVLVQGSSELRAGRISVTLADESDDVRFIRARWNVTGLERQDDELGSQMRFEAQELSLIYDEASGELGQSELESRPGELVVVESSDASQLARRLTAPRISVDFTNERPSGADASGGVEITEFFLFARNAHLLRSCSRQASAGFSADGSISTLRLAGQVDLHQSDLHTVGDEVVRRDGDGSTRVTGTPASVYTVRGVVHAPTIIHFAEGDRVEASGGVRAELVPDRGFAMIREEAPQDEPIRVTSERASWEAETSEFGFSGNVRAWQGEDFVIANELVGEDRGDRLRAEGKVKTVIKSRRTDDEDATPEERAPVEVTAGKFVYQRQERVLRYTGSPVARQAGRILRCEDLELALDEDGEFERMICRRSVVIEDPAEKRLVRGDLAIYDPGASILEVSGRPAVMRDPEGSEVRGSVVVYDLEKGVASVRSGAVPPIPAVEETPGEATQGEEGASDGD